MQALNCLLLHPTPPAAVFANVRNCDYSVFFYPWYRTLLAPMTPYFRRPVHSFLPFIHAPPIIASHFSGPPCPGRRASRCTPFQPQPALPSCDAYYMVALPLNGLPL